MVGSLVAVFALTLLNGLFAGAEIAVLSVRKTRVNELVEQGQRAARAVLWLRNQPERFLATVQVGITLVATSAAALGGETIAHELAERMRTTGHMGGWAPRIALVVVVVGISFVQIVLGELVPKSLALRSAEGYALLAARPLRRIATIVYPVVWALTRASNLVLRLFHDQTSFTEARLSPEEIQELVEEAARVGSIDAKTSEIASRALQFRELRAHDVLVPRQRIVAVSIDASRDELRVCLTAARHQRLPVYEGARENFVGYVTVKEVLLAALADHEFSLRTLVRPIRFVPEFMPAVDLLRELQSERAPLALVADETGAITGLVTLSDLLEELVGEILNETDPAPPAIRRLADGSAVLPASITIREANRALDIELPEPEGYTTVAGLCLHIAERIPQTGTVLELVDGARIEVLEASQRRVRTVRIYPAPPRRDSLEPLESR